MSALKALATSKELSAAEGTALAKNAQALLEIVTDENGGNHALMLPCVIVPGLGRLIVILRSPFNGRINNHIHGRQH